MSINYTSSNMPVGNIAFGLTNSNTISCWGACFVDSNRFVLTLVKSNLGAMIWKKIDVQSIALAYYDMPFSPADAGVDPSDLHPTKGNFLSFSNNKLYYLKGNVLHQRNIDTGASEGTKLLRNSGGVALVGTSLNHVLVEGNEVYVASKADGKIYHWTIASYDAAPIDAAQEVTVSEFSGEVNGLVAQPGADTDIVVITKTTAKQAIKFSSTLVRKGESIWTDPSTNITLALFRGSILYMLSNDSLTAGVGLYFYRFGDGSTNIIAPSETIFTISSSQIKAGTQEPLTLSFTAKDGYGLPFQPDDYVRFSIVKYGDAYDSNDGALALTAIGPFRNSQGNPLNTQLDLTFDPSGSALAYWQAPVEIPADTVLHRVKVKYPSV